MELDDSKWCELSGGYHEAYDASRELKKLELAISPNEIQEILEILWNELHHQGDVGLASYYSVPHIVRIAMDKQLFDWKIIGLPLTIEHQRNHGNNPKVPDDLVFDYRNAIQEMGSYALNKIRSELDDSTYITALSAIATASGRIDLAKAIIELADRSTLEEFLEQF